MLTDNPSSLRAEILALIRLSAPLIAAQLAGMGMLFFDTVMLGRAGPLPLAAVALGAGFWTPLYLFSLGVLMAISSQIAHQYGAGERHAIGHSLRQGLWLAAGLALGISVLLQQLSPIMSALGVTSSVIPLTQDYLLALSLGVLPLFLYNALRFTSEGLGHTRPSMLISLLGLLVNVLGNYLLIFGHWGAPALGAFGCGLATAIAYWVMLLALTLYMLTQGRYRPFALFSQFEWPQRSTQWSLLRLGLPIGLGIFAESSIFGAVALVIGFLGPQVVAGHQIALNVAGMSFMVPLSLGIATSVRVGHAMGAGEYALARQRGWLGIGVAALFMSIMVLVLSLSAPWVVHLYTDDATVLAIAAHLLLFAAAFQLPDGVQVATSGALRGMKDTKIPMFITLFAYWGVGLPVGYSLCIYAQWGADGMWVGLITGLSTAALLLSGRFYWLTHKQGAC